MPLRQIERLRLAPERDRNVFHPSAKLSLRRMSILPLNVFQIHFAHAKSNAVFGFQKFKQPFSFDFGEAHADVNSVIAVIQRKSITLAGVAKAQCSNFLRSEFDSLSLFKHLLPVIRSAAPIAEEN